MILLFGAGYLVRDFIQLDAHSHSVSDLLMNFFFHTSFVWLGYSAIAIILNNWKDFGKK